MKCGGTDASNELQKQITQLENEIANMPPSPARTAMVAELTALRSQMGTLQQTYVWTGIGCMSTQFSTLMTDALRALGGIMGLFILWCIVSNGFKIMVSRGNPEALKKAQEEITSCVVGFIVLMFSVVILRIIGVNILALPFLR